MMMSEARAEKNYADGRADYLAKKRKSMKDYKVARLQEKIEEDKKSIKECLDQNFIEMAESKMIRLGKMTKTLTFLNQEF